VPGKVTKKKAGARLWMRLDRWGTSEVVELDKASIIRRAGLPPRDLRILGPVFSRSSSILGEHTPPPPSPLAALFNTRSFVFCGDKSKKTQTLVSS
jgi:magnesium transporter